MGDCLVYFFTGFLDSGKTSVICSWIDGENFRDKKILVISTEEGEEEYIDENYPNAAPVIVHAETEDFSKEMMFDLDKEHKPDVIFIEWNGMVSPAEFFDKIDVPRRWLLAAAVVVVDTSTYTEYFRSMQTIFADYYRYCDTVIFNRVDPEVNDIPRLRASCKSVNPGMSINFLDNDNEIIPIEDHLPFDLESDPCVISADDFGLFYTDALDNVARYNGKRVSLIGKAVVFREFKGQAFALQRQAYTCCAADMGQINMLCFYNVKSGFPVGQWLRVTGTIRYFEDKQNGQSVDIPCITVEDYALTSKPDNEIIYFN
ncbi:MAG: hypothetical protein II167_01085 [Clostridiales bacterium]|nr:hypothetical protein [Clostridiales bacterium]